MDIREKFLELTSITTPHGTEELIRHLLPENLIKDEFGNYYLEVGKRDEINTMFTAHLDTVGHESTDVNHIFEKIDYKGDTDEIIKTDGNSILGADDRAGITILLYMIENNIKGLYYFFLGEERGCIGSSKVSYRELTEPQFPNINKCISFDRRGYNEIITTQIGSTCCSDDFAYELARQLNQSNEKLEYVPSPRGIFTDSKEFMSVYNECTNIAVGYFNEHSTFEQQNISHLERLANACLEVDWNNLPISRQINDRLKKSKIQYYSHLD